MIAVVIAGPSSLALWSIGLLIALGILVAHLGAYRPKVKRIIVSALIVIVAETTVAPVTLDAFVIENPCRKYQIDDWQFWAAGCFLP